MPEPIPSTSFENRLEDLYSLPVPDPGFSRRLEIRLAARGREMDWRPASRQPSPMAALRAMFRRPALAIALVALLLLIGALGWIGPRTVLAEVQRLLGYNPHAGYVQPGETLILPSPIEQTQGEVTLRIDSVIASPTGTQVILTVSGLPREKFRMPDMETPEDQKPYLELPGGTHLLPSGYSSGIGGVLQASLSFPALPAGVSQVTLGLPRLPSLPAGFAPENWAISLTLQQTSLTPAPGAAQALLTRPYTPENATASAGGVTARLLQVAHSPDETALQVQFTWENPDWQWLTRLEASLSDETGKPYARREPPLGPGFEPGNMGANPNGASETYRFDPLDPQARTGNLVLDQLAFDVISDARFTFDLGSHPTPGQTWDLSQLPGSRLEISGIPIQLLSATLKSGRDAGYQLDLLVQTSPTSSLSVEMLGLSNYPDRAVSASSQGLPGNQFLLSIELPALPANRLTLYLPDAGLIARGPWEIRWEVR